MGVETQLETLGPQVRRVQDSDGYRSSIRGVTVETIRTGAGIGSNVVRSMQETALAATAIDISFPILSRSDIPEERLTVAAIRSAPPGTRWCGIDVGSGFLLAYGPGVEHTATNPVGVRFAFAVVELPALQQLAESLEMDFRAPSRGKVEVLPPTVARAITGPLARLVDSEESRVEARRLLEADLLHAIVRDLRSGRRPSRNFRGSRIDDRHVVFTCVEYAEAIGRIPTVGEMCTAAFVSERRLRKAFTEVYQMPPTRFFRMWALAEAHRRLAVAEPQPGIVARVATDVGLSHLGRFATRYRAIYGKPPSHTALHGQNDDPIRAAKG